MVWHSLNFLLFLKKGIYRVLYYMPQIGAPGLQKKHLCNINIEKLVVTLTSFRRTENSKHLSLLIV